MFDKLNKSSVSPPASQAQSSSKPHGASLLLIICLAVASLFISHQPLGALVLTPVDFLATNLHELGHALFCVVTGGTVHGLTIFGDGDGHAGLTFGAGGIPFIYYQTGYLGCTMFGCLLLYFGSRRENARAVLMLLGLLVGAGSAYFIVATFAMANYAQAALYSLGLALCMGTVLFLAGYKLSAAVAQYLLLFLAVQISLNALNDVVWLVELSSGMVGAHSFSDATNMAQLTGVPAVVWSVWWGLASLGMLFFTLKQVARRA